MDRAPGRANRSSLAYRQTLRDASVKGTNVLIHTRNVHAVSQAILFPYQSPQENKDSLEGWELLWTSRTGNGQPWNMCKAHQTLRSMVE